MKKLKCRYVIYLFCICSLFPCLLSSCKYDDSELIDRVDNLEDRLAKLEEQCKQINANINSLQTIVSALENANQITSVSELVENGKKVGYKIEFTKSDPIYIYHGQDGADGSDGTDGYVPQIGVEKDKDGIYYWTLDSSWLTDKDGNKIKAVGLDGKDGQDGEDGKDGADGSDGSNGSNGSNGRDGVTPKLRINEGNWEVSYNNGSSWEVLGPATGGTAENSITDVIKEDNYVIFTIKKKDGNTQTIEVPLYDGFSITFIELGEGVTELGMETEDITTLTYKLENLQSGKSVKVSAIGEGVRTSVDQATKKLTITTDANFEGGKVLVHATDGNHVATVELTITKEVITYIVYRSTAKLEPSDWAFPPEENPDLEYLSDKSEYNEATQEGKIAIKGIITVFDGYAFSTNVNNNLISIEIPEGVTEIANSAFSSCYSLTSVSFPSTLKVIGYGAFNNTSLTGDGNKNLIIPEGVEEIDMQAFKCDNSSSNPTYTKVTLPSTIKSIGSQAFTGSMNNTRSFDIYCYAEEVPTVTTKSFTARNNPVYVPQSALSKYQADDNWKGYTLKAIE